MQKYLFLLVSLFCCVLSKGQITIIGHNELNNSPLLNTIIYVKQDGVLKETINTKSSANFMVKLKFDHDYSIYFNNTKL